MCAYTWHVRLGECGSRVKVYMKSVCNQLIYMIRYVENAMQFVVAGMPFLLGNRFENKRLIFTKRSSNKSLISKNVKN